MIEAMRRRRMSKSGVFGVPFFVMLLFLMDTKFLAKAKEDGNHTIIGAEVDRKDELKYNLQHGPHASIEVLPFHSVENSTRLDSTFVGPVEGPKMLIESIIQATPAKRGAVDEADEGTSWEFTLEWDFSICKFYQITKLSAAVYNYVKQINPEIRFPGWKLDVIDFEVEPEPCCDNFSCWKLGTRFLGYRPRRRLSRVITIFRTPTVRCTGSCPRQVLPVGDRRRLSELPELAAFVRDEYEIPSESVLVEEQFRIDVNYNENSQLLVTKATIYQPDTNDWKEETYYHEFRPETVQKWIRVTQYFRLRSTLTSERGERDLCLQPKGATAYNQNRIVLMECNDEIRAQKWKTDLGTGKLRNPVNGGKFCLRQVVNNPVMWICTSQRIKKWNFHNDRTISYANSPKIVIDAAVWNRAVPKDGHLVSTRWKVAGKRAQRYYREYEEWQEPSPPSLVPTKSPSSSPIQLPNPTTYPTKHPTKPPTMPPTKRPIITPSPTTPPVTLVLKQSIRGEDERHYSGVSVSLSENGSKIAIGERGIDRVRIFQRSGQTWIPLFGGPRLDLANSAYFGSVTAISDDGLTVAVGGFRFSGSRGIVGVYKLLSGFRWIAFKILEGEEGDEYGRSVALSGDASILVVGATQSITSDLRGYVRVYETNSFSTRGSDIIGDRFDGIGGSISLTNDGNILAVGSTFGNSVDVYEWIFGSWTRRGNKIIGASSFGHSMSLSSQSGQILVIGAHLENGGDGSVYIYRWNEKESDWNLLEVIRGEAETYGIGYSVSVSGDGSVVAFGGSYSNIRPPSDIAVFIWNGSKFKQQASLSGGYYPSVSLSDDGRILAFGMQQDSSTARTLLLTTYRGKTDIYEMERTSK